MRSEGKTESGWIRSGWTRVKYSDSLMFHDPIGIRQTFSSARPNKGRGILLYSRRGGEERQGMKGTEKARCSFKRGLRVQIVESRQEPEADHFEWRYLNLCDV